jgi:hypothetical protein
LFYYRMTDNFKDNTPVSEISLKEKLAELIKKTPNIVFL